MCDLVGFGGGLTSVSDSAQSKLVRFNSDGRTFYDVSINLYDALINNPDDPKYLLQESDRLYIRKKHEYKMLYDVTVQGEVMYPGQYAIEKNNTKLSEVIRMAGDFSGNENLREAMLIRKNNFATRDLEYERLKDIEVVDRNHIENDYIRNYQRSFEGAIHIDFVKLYLFFALN